MVQSNTLKKQPIKWYYNIKNKKEYLIMYKPIIRDKSGNYRLKDGRPIKKIKGKYILE